MRRFVGCVFHFNGEKLLQSEVTVPSDTVETHGEVSIGLVDQVSLSRMRVVNYNLFPCGVRVSRVTGVEVELEGGAGGGQDTVDGGWEGRDRASTVCAEAKQSLSPGDIVYFPPPALVRQSAP